MGKKEKEEKRMRKEAKRAAREQSVTRGSQSGEALLEQVSKKLTSYQADQSSQASRVETLSNKSASVSSTNYHQSDSTTTMTTQPANNNDCKQLTDRPDTNR